jgi:hypothetical protein
MTNRIADLLVNQKLSRAGQGCERGAPYTFVQVQARRFFPLEPSADRDFKNPSMTLFCAQYDLCGPLRNWDQ